MKQILLTLFFFTTLSSYGQRIRFTDTSNHWKMYNLTCCDMMSTYPSSYFTNLFYWGGDTVLGGMTYHRLDCSLIREDTIAGKVYTRNNTGCASLDSVKRVLYDYNWLVGDTVRQPNYLGVSPEFWVANIDSVQINSLWYKVWKFTGRFGSGGSAPGYYVIEGIGCTNRYDYAIRPYPVFENSSQLFCFTNQGVSYTLSHSVPSWGLLGNVYFDNSTSCMLPLQTAHVLKQEHAVRVSPNPITTDSRIELPYHVTSGRLTIINGVGQIVVATNIENKQEILVGDNINAAGVYFYRVTDTETGRVFSGKFVAQ